MKKLIILVAFLSSLAFARYVWEGVGKTVSVTDEAQVVLASPDDDASDYCYFVSILNTGSDAIYMQKNVATNAFSVTTAIKIPAGQAYNSYAAPNQTLSRAIKHIVLGCAEGESSTAVVAFE